MHRLYEAGRECKSHPPARLKDGKNQGVLEDFSDLVKATQMLLSPKLSISGSVRTHLVVKGRASEKSTGRAGTGGSDDVIMTHSHSLLEVETVLICPGLRGFPGCRTLCSKIRSVWDELVTLVYLFSCAVLSIFSHRGKMAAGLCPTLSGTPAEKGYLSITSRSPAVLSDWPDLGHMY